MKQTYALFFIMTSICVGTDVQLADTKEPFAWVAKSSAAPDAGTQYFESANLASSYSMERLKALEREQDKLNNKVLHLIANDDKPKEVEALLVEMKRLRTEIHDIMIYQERIKKAYRPAENVRAYHVFDTACKKLAVVEKDIEILEQNKAVIGEVKYRNLLSLLTKKRDELNVQIDDHFQGRFE